MLIPKHSPKKQRPILRTKIAGTRLTVSEAQSLADRAASFNLTPSEYMHQVLLEALGSPSDPKLILAYLELLTEDVARLETVVTYIVANLRAGNNLTAEGLQQLTAAAARQKKGYAAARLKAARANALNGKNSHE